MTDLVAARKMTKARQAFIALRDQILSEKLPPGTHLTLRPIAQSLGMSVGSVSEAIRELVYEGLVEMEPHYGARVKQIDAGAIRGRHILRVAVECEAIRQCVEQMSRRQISHLGIQAEELDRLIDIEEKLDEMREKDLQFHTTICDLSGVATLQKVFQSTHPGQLLAIDPVNLDDSLEIPYRTHIELVDAIKTGDPNIAEQAMREHCERSLLLQLHSS
ncbi:MAG: GntR family transcriptional regulator [Pirellulales bacterium]